MKSIATIFFAVGIFFAGLQWWQIFYRVHLYYSDYGGQRYVNHVGDDVFTIIHVINVTLLLTGAFSAWAFWRQPPGWRWFGTVITLANAGAWLAFTYMHSSGILVGYDEFLRHMKGE